MPTLYLGTQGWSYPSWVGSFYPTGTPSNAYLEAYAARFSTVELDTTFYAIPRTSTVDGWRTRAPEHFLFAAKFPQVITHQKGLADCAEETHAFLVAMARLEHKLGPLLLQMPPSWGANAFETLANFLRGLPDGFRYALEVRHRSWLGPEMLPRLTELLRKHTVALCLTQQVGMPALDQVTAPFAYIRWLGRREDIIDNDFSRVRINRDAQLNRWAEQISRYLQEGITVFGYFNNHYQGHAPASVRALQARLVSVETDPLSPDHFKTSGR